MTMKKTIGLLGGLLVLGSTSCIAQTFYQSVDREGNITLSDRPMPNLQIVKKYNININDPIRRPHVQQEQSDEVKKPYTHRIKNYSPSTMMEENLINDRIRDAKEYRDCIDANSSRRDLGASLELLCQPRNSVWANTDEIARYQNDMIQRGSGPRR